MKFREFMKGVIDKLWNRKELKEKAKIDVAISKEMEEAIKLWNNIYENKPPWLDDTNGKTLKLGKAISSEIARLTTIEFESSISGNDTLNKEYQVFLKKLRKSVQSACGTGGIVFKPHVVGKNIVVDRIKQNDFFPTAFDGDGNMVGVVFLDQIERENSIYTRLETHEFSKAKREYHITNKVFKRKKNTMVESMGYEVSLNEVPEWEKTEPELLIGAIEAPLFAYFKIPGDNTEDSSIEMGVPVFENAINLIKDADR